VTAKLIQCIVPTLSILGEKPPPVCERSPVGKQLNHNVGSYLVHRTHLITLAQDSNTMQITFVPTKSFNLLFREAL